MFESVCAYIFYCYAPEEYAHIALHMSVLKLCPHIRPGQQSKPYWLWEQRSRSPVPKLFQIVLSNNFQKCATYFELTYPIVQNICDKKSLGGVMFYEHLLFIIYFCCNWFPTNNTKSMFTSTNLALCLLLTCFYYYVPFLAVEYFCNNCTCNYLYIMLRSLWQSNLHATAVYVFTCTTFRHYRNSRYVRVFSIVTRTLSLKIASLQTGLIS